MRRAAHCGSRGNRSSAYTTKARPAQRSTARTARGRSGKTTSGPRPPHRAVPAIAGRAISAPHLPPFYFDEFGEGSRGRRCAVTYVSSRPFFVATAPRDEGAGRPFFRNATVTLLEGGGAITSFDTPGEELRPRGAVGSTR